VDLFQNWGASVMQTGKTLFLALSVLGQWAGGSFEACAAPSEEGCKDEVTSASRAFGKSVNVSIKLTQRRFACGSTLSGRYWGETDIPPSKVVSGLRISFGSRPVVIYASALAGLGDIESIKIIKKNKAYVVRLISIGEEPYFADLTIVGGSLTSRRVYYPLFSDEAYEETRYHFTVK
jgi:hypothetical protein